MTGWLVTAAVLTAIGVAGYVYVDRQLARIDKQPAIDRPGDDDQFADWKPVRHPDTSETPDNPLHTNDKTEDHQ